MYVNYIGSNINQNIYGKNKKSFNYREISFYGYKDQFLQNNLFKLDKTNIKTKLGNGLRNLKSKVLTFFKFGNTARKNNNNLPLSNTLHYDNYTLENNKLLKSKIVQRMFDLEQNIQIVKGKILSINKSIGYYTYDNNTTRDLWANLNVAVNKLKNLKKALIDAKSELYLLSKKS